MARGASSSARLRAMACTPAFAAISSPLARHSVAEEPSETLRSLQAIAIAYELGHLGPVDGTVRQVEVVGHPPVPSDVLGKTEAPWVRGDQLLVLSRVRSNAERHPSVSVLVDREPREVLPVDHEASMGRVPVVGSRLWKRQTQGRQTCAQGGFTHVPSLLEPP